MDPTGECLEPLCTAVSALTSWKGPPTAVGLDIGRPPTVYMLELDAHRGARRLAGFAAPPAWHAFGFALPDTSAPGSRRAIVADRCGLVFESTGSPSVNVTSAATPVGTCTGGSAELILARDIAILVMGHRTSPPTVTASSLASTLLLDWQLVHAVDPSSPEVPSGLGLPRDFRDLRRWLARVRPPGAWEICGSGALLDWLDDGALARWICTSLPEPAVLCSALADLGVEPMFPPLDAGSPPPECG
ncbi:MAG: hypothetical protein KatS3mg008_1938 [Acidimicrobiales bacterium]|nr:MAG: hypothetical protein KatS3mg008_1938 [Acidimicrobiales bacterium]